MNNPHPKSEFTDVDRANIPQNYVECLDAQRSIDFVDMYKQRVRALLDIQPGQQILEVGAGTGEDTQEAAKLVGPTEHVIGLDFSQTMVEEAMRSIRFFHAMTYFITTGYKQK